MSTNEIEGQQKEETAEIKKSIVIDLFSKLLPIPMNLLIGFRIKPFWSQR
jgi:hypothetical protein